MCSYYILTGHRCYQAMKIRFQEQNFLEKIIFIILIAAILGVMGTAGCAMSQTREKFTEFYILGSKGKAIDYPEEFKVGKEDSVIMGIINREQETIRYRVEVRIEDVNNNQVGSIELAPGEKWEEMVSFIPDRAGDSQRVVFLLYKDGQNESYLELHLWINVKEGT
ncbi:DUF1616 domain-containing protein [Chloroflexota bacterium]